MAENEPGTGADEVLAEVIRRIVQVAAPERIVLFGSAARGEAVDVVVKPEEDVDRYRYSLGMVIAPALREGRVVYAA